MELVHVLSDVVTEEECQAIQEPAMTELHAGTLAGVIAPECKVMQAYRDLSGLGKRHGR